MAGLLFLALAYLAVGQASVNRSGAQTAADAAALAAAQDERDQLRAQWVGVLADPEKWQAIFEGRVAFKDPCGRAGQLATQNHAALNGCTPAGLLKYRVEVQTDESVGRSVVPGSEDYKSKASAIAEIESLCDPPDSNADNGTTPQLTCQGKKWDLNPDDPTDLPKPQDLFDVHLANDH